MQYKKLGGSSTTDIIPNVWYGGEMFRKVSVLSSGGWINNNNNFSIKVFITGSLNNEDDRYNEVSVIGNVSANASSATISSIYLYNAKLIAVMKN